MKNNNFWEYIVKNKYIILCVTIVFILALTGIIGKLMEIIFTVILLIIAVYVGKKLQEDDKYIKKIFESKKKNVEYTVKDETKKS